jgi:hypothetical protein
MSTVGNLLIREVHAFVAAAAALQCGLATALTHALPLIATGVVLVVPMPKT